jgi:hypothetical protein
VHCASFFVVCALGVSLSGCSSGCVEIIDAEDQEPLSAEPIGPRGMPVLSPLALTGDAGAVSSCRADIPGERDHVGYDARHMKRGSAKRLLGRVAVLEIRLASERGEAWSRIALRHADKEGADARAFILREAARRGIGDLTIDVMPWFVTTELPRVELAVDSRGAPDWQQAHDLEKSAFDHVARATGVSVPSVVAALGKAGYREVAVMLRLPTQHVLREFALPSDGIDAAIVQQTPSYAESGTYAHELLHLFGADDLYRVTEADPRDENDLMGGRRGRICDARIGDATAWAIGWQPSPPNRAYAFGPHHTARHGRLR